MVTPDLFAPIAAAAVCIACAVLTAARKPSETAASALAAAMFALGASQTGAALSLAGAGWPGGALYALGQAGAAPALLLFSLSFGKAERVELLARWQPAIVALTIAAALLWFSSLARGPFEIGAWGIRAAGYGQAMSALVAAGLMAALINLEGTYMSVNGSARSAIRSTVLGAGLAAANIVFVSLHLMAFGSIGPAATWLGAAMAAASAIAIASNALRGAPSAFDLLISRHSPRWGFTAAAAGAFIGASVIAAAVGRGADGAAALAAAPAAALAALILSSEGAPWTIGRWPSLSGIGRHNYRDSWLEATEKISSKMDIADIKAVLAEMVAEALKATAVNVWLYDKHTRAYAASSARVEHRLWRVPSSHPLIGRLSASGEPVVLGDLCLDAPAALASLPAGASLCAPLLAGKELVGFILISGAPPGRRYRRCDLDLVRAVATQAAVQIKNIRLGQDLLDMKETDAFGRMSSFLLHDLKNFTNSLALLSHNARSNISDPDFQREAIKAIDHTVARMKALIGKIPGGASLPRLELRHADLRAALYRAAARLAPEAAGRLSIDDPGPAQPCSIDSEAVETVFFNLFMNAHEAMGSCGQIRVTFHKDSLFQCVRISDTGSGIPRTLMEKGLFRPFLTTKGNGLGVGLFQCRTVMEEHGGHIEAESEEGKGSVFTLRFPRTDSTCLASKAG